MWRPTISLVTTPWTLWYRFTLLGFAKIAASSAVIKAESPDTFKVLLAKFTPSPVCTIVSSENPPLDTRVFVSDGPAARINACNGIPSEADQIPSDQSAVVIVNTVVVAEAFAEVATFARPYWPCIRASSRTVFAARLRKNTGY